MPTYSLANANGLGLLALGDRHGAWEDPRVTGWLTILISGASGAVVTLLGVVTGGAVASRAQRHQWSRNKQIDASAAVIQESTRMQLALRRQWLQGEDTDWTAWNQALAIMWLVGNPGCVAAARRMDRVFWLCGARIKSGQMRDEETWGLVRDEMEIVRRDFINAARSAVVGAKQPVADVPVARPSLDEIRQMFGETLSPQATDVPSTGEAPAEG